MNKENLEKLLRLIDKINPEMFSMKIIREIDDDWGDVKCRSVGSLIGYATVLDENLKNRSKYLRDSDGDIKFTLWSEIFFGIDAYEDIWKYVFDSKWSDNPETNTLQQAKIRIQKILNGFDPFEDWNGKYEVQKI